MAMEWARPNPAGRALGTFRLHAPREWGMAGKEGAEGSGNSVAMAFQGGASQRSSVAEAARSGPGAGPQGCPPCCKGTVPWVPCPTWGHSPGLRVWTFVLMDAFNMLARLLPQPHGTLQLLGGRHLISYCVAGVASEGSCWRSGEVEVTPLVVLFSCPVFILANMFLLV